MTTTGRIAWGAFAVALMLPDIVPGQPAVPAVSCIEPAQMQMYEQLLTEANRRVAAMGAQVQGLQADLDKAAAEKK